MVSKREGFTLIELLVVIAIIAILAAILFPVFARAKARAAVTKCLSNTKQWAVAVQMYADNHAGRYPYAGANNQYAHIPRTDGGSRTCYDAVGSYVKSENLKWCPLWTGSTFEQYKQIAGWSYWFFCKHRNPYVQGYNNGMADLCGYPTSSVRFPSKKPLICEVRSQHEYENEANLYNVAYCDGHSKTLVIGSYKEEMQKLYVGRDGSGQ